MIQLIVEGEELTKISEKAKVWLYNLVLNGKSGPFTLNKEKKEIILTAKLIDQIELF